MTTLRFTDSWAKSVEPLLTVPHFSQAGGCPRGHAGGSMKFLSWIGAAFVVLWLVLWLGLKIVVGTVHLLLLLGLVLIVWGLVQARSA